MGEKRSLGRENSIHRARAERLALIFFLSLFSGCSREGSKLEASTNQAESQAAPSPQNVVRKAPALSQAAQEKAAAEAADAEARSVAESREKEGEERLRRYASFLPERHPSLCESPGVILNVAWPSQPSRRVWLKELLRAEEDLAALIRENQTVRLLSPMYGERNYGRSTNTSDITRLALVVECDRPLECAAIAGFYGRVDPFAKLQSYCGMMPGTTGGSFPLELEKLKAQTVTYPHGVCARYRACSALLDKPAPSCDGLAPSSAKCAVPESCEEALQCFAAEPLDPKRKLWSDAPQPMRYQSRPGLPLP